MPRLKRKFELPDDSKMSHGALAVGSSMVFIGPVAYKIAAARLDLLNS